MAHNPKVVLATTTFSKNYDLRARLAVRTAEEAARASLPLVVVDGGSAPELVRKLKDLGVHVFPEKHHGMGPSRRQAIHEAWRLAGYEWVMWLEPEKYPLVHLVPGLLAFNLGSLTDIIVPERLTLASYPLVQQHAEQMGNAGFYKATGAQLDVWFGPRLIGPRGVPHFLDWSTPQTDDKWMSIFGPLLTALAAGLKLASVRVGYVHPNEQTAEEEKDPDMDLKRLAQLNNLLPDIYNTARALGLPR